MPYLIENILLNEDALFEMANIWKEDTGLPYHLWIDSKGIERGNEHCGHPRLKIQVDNNLIPVDICDDPQIPDSVLEISSKDFIIFDTSCLFLHISSFLNFFNNSIYSFKYTKNKIIS